MYCAHFCIAVTIENKHTAAKKNGGGDFTGSYQWQVDRQVASKWYNTIGLVHSVLGSLKLSSYSMQASCNDPPAFNSKAKH